MMAEKITQPNHNYSTHIKDLIDYPDTGVRRKVFVQDSHTQQNLFCIAAGSQLEEHSSAKNATLIVLEGEGQLTLNGEAISLTQGAIVHMAAHAPHALEAKTNLAFWLILAESNH